MKVGISVVVKEGVFVVVKYGVSVVVKIVEVSLQIKQALEVNSTDMQVMKPMNEIFPPHPFKDVLHISILEEDLKMMDYRPFF